MDGQPGDRISVVIPTLNEAAMIVASVTSAFDAGADEVIVVDGGSNDATVVMAKAAGATLVHAGRGRGVQLRAGAAAATCDVLLFLHADAIITADACREGRQLMMSPGCAAVAFRLRIDGDRWMYRVIEAVANWRSRWLRLPYGDQGLLVQRRHYDDAGGFDAVVLMEDVAIVRRLRKRGRVLLARSSVTVSARRWQAGGAMWSSLVNVGCLLGYAVGVSPERLTGWRDRATAKRCGANVDAQKTRGVME